MSAVKAHAMRRTKNASPTCERRIF
jgi:hypothetical protein